MQNTRPILIFGRTATIEASWLAFNEAATSATISEIGFFNPSEAKRFIDGYVATLDKEGAIARHRPAYEKRRDELLDKLSRDTQHATGSVQFDGYAPVLLAVSKVLSEVSNFATPMPAASKGAVGLIEAIPNEILSREQGKLLSAIQEQLPAMGVEKQTLYTPNEQRARLLAKLVSGVSLSSCL